MRSSRFAPDPIDPGPAGFAHRGLHDGATFIENSFPAFVAALEHGAGIECDLRLTMDEQLVVFHDADTRRLCAASVEIGAATLAELGRFTVSGHPIPTLAALLALVDGRVPLLLEVKVLDRLWRIGSALVKALGGYGGRLGVMSFDPRVARWLKTNAPHVRRGLVVRAEVSPLRRWGAMKLADPDFLAVDRAALPEAWVAAARRRMPVYSWTIASAAQRATAEPLADALIWESHGRP